ncbi:phospholipase A2 inhibitor beta-like isoform X1 [Euwallacea fornicatus]|uniref:phospholipase A2 inhibitor beta-like isoform X1 n=1 Tax=Euwallacea fornicatus TaxID=995702 RepID=UPI00338F5543
MIEEVFRIILIFIVLGTPLCGAQECEYSNNERSYVCDKIVHQFPNIYYGNYNLRCTDCEINNFTNQTFIYDNLLNMFNLTKSAVQNIGSKSFEHFKNLRYLYMQNNGLKIIAPEAFKGLTQLYELHLEDNLLSTLEPGFLAGVSSNLVNISRNLLDQLPAKAFTDVAAVLSLDLSRNYLKNLDKDTFDGIKDLEDLDLSWNTLCHLPLGVFKSLSGLKRLNLDENKFSRLQYGVFSGLKNLNFLFLARNSLKDFDSAVLLSIMHLTNLDISGNAIYNFDVNEILLNVPTLRVISFEDNIFSCTLLKNIIQFLKRKRVEIENNISRFELLNINGIACIEDYTIDNSISLNYFLQKAQDQTNLLNSYC